MKIKLLLASVIIFLISTISAYNETRFEVCIGGMAPIETIENANNTLTFGGQSDRYTLVTFWESSDAESRLLMNRYDALFHRNPLLRSKIHHVGVNFDSEDVLFKEIVVNDGLDVENQYNVQGRAFDTIKTDYHLWDNLGAVLIDPNGTIVAFNPDETVLLRLT